MSKYDPVEGTSLSVWEPSASKTFTSPVPDNIPDKTTFELPAENIKGEEVLVIIYATGLTGLVYTLIPAISTKMSSSQAARIYGNW